MEAALLCLIFIVAFVLWARIDDLDRRQKDAAEDIRDLRESLTKVQATLANVLAQSREAAVAAPEAARPQTATPEVAPVPVVAATPAPGRWTPTHRIPRGGLDVWPLPNSPRPPIGALPENLAVAVQSWSGGWALVVTETGWRGWVNGGVLVAVVSASAWVCRQCGYEHNHSTAARCFNCSAPKGAPADAAKESVAAPRRAAAAPVSRPVAAARSTPVAAREVPAQPQNGPLELLLLKLGLTSPAPGESWSRSALEEWFEGRMLAIVGGIALLLGAAFFLSLAFSRGWISPELRVGTGLAVGACMLVLGELAFSRLHGIVGHVLVAVGLAIISLALFAATPRMFGLIAVEWALLGIFVAAIFAAVTAVRHDSEIVAAFSLIAVLASPPVLGASPNLATLLFIAAALVGTTGVALFRTWPWLPPLAFVLAAPQFAFYITGGPMVEEGLIAVAGFWLVNLIAAGGEEIRHSTDRLRTATVTLLLADAAVTLWAGFTVLSGTLTVWRGTFLAAQAVAYIALALFFFVRNGDRHPFGLIVGATGVASLTMAVPIQFGGPPVPIAWAAEAVALAWVAVIRRHPYSAGLSVVLATLALGHLVAIEYPPDSIPLLSVGAGFSRSIPFVGPEGMTFAFMIAALAVAAVAVPIAWVRARLAALAGIVAIYVFPFEMNGPALVAGWAALAAVGLVVYARVVRTRIAPDFNENRVPALGLPWFFGQPLDSAVSWLSRVARPSFLVVALAAGVGAIAYLVTYEYPADLISAGPTHEIPFYGLPGLAFGILILAIAGAGLLIPGASVRIGLTALAGLLAIYVFPFELAGPSLVAAWAAIAAVGLVVEARVIEPRAGPAFDLRWLLDTPADEAPEWLRTAARPCVMAVAVIAGTAALAHLASVEYPLASMLVGTPHDTPFVGLPGVAFAILLVAIAGAGLFIRAASVRIGLTALAGLLALYVFPFELSGPALVAAWAAFGAVAFVVEAVVINPRVGRAFAPADLTGYLRPAVRAAGALAGAAVLTHLVWLDFPAGQLGKVILSSIPYGGQEGLSLAAALAGLGVAGLAMRARWFRLGVTGIGAALLVYTVTFEMAASWAAAPWGVLALASILVVRRIALVRAIPVDLPSPLEAVAERLPYAAAGMALVFLVVQALWLADVESFGRHVAGDLPLTGTPFLDERTFVLAILAATVLVSGWVWRGVTARVLAAIVAAVPIAWLLPFEVRPGYAVAGWSALALAGFLYLRIVPAARVVLGGASLALASCGAVVALAVVAPPDRLVVSVTTTVLGWTLLTDATVALGALVIALGAGALLHRADPLARLVLAAAGIAAVYMLSIAVVDQFRLQVGTGRPLEELQKEAHVGLSVLWSILGAAGFAAGLVAHRPPIRLFGLALLSLATVKVFLVDLAQLDVSYRVLSFVALGFLLLISAAVYSRIQHPPSHSHRPAPV
jgi:uncharacterized membrane protein